jgi:hypothetical protein
LSIAKARYPTTNPGRLAGVALRINDSHFNRIASGMADTQGIDLGRKLSDLLLLSSARAYFIGGCN